MTQDPYGWTIFCDDIRHEVGNKFSFMGVYKGDLIVHGAFPATLPKFGLAVSYRVYLDDARLEEVTLAVYLPGDEDGNPSIKGAIPISEMVAKADPPSRGGDTFREFQVVIVASPLTLKQSGRIKVRAIGGAGVIKLGSLRVEQAAPVGEQTG